MGHPCRTPLVCRWEEWVCPDTAGKSLGGTVQGLNEVYKGRGKVQPGQHCEEGGVGDGVESLIEINVEAVATN